jgi:biofilm PGA synthesis N-glycosyltransferase PgaC
MTEIQDRMTLMLYIIFVTACVVQVGYYLFVYIRFAFYRRKSITGGKQPVSVIICARNEVNNLRRYLVPVLEQDYPSYEVILVNDCSWDESSVYLDELQKKYSHLKVVTIKEQEKYRHAKKFALTLGIKAAAHDVLLFTDADCEPAGRNWLEKMQDHFREGTEIVLGYGPYRKEKGFLNKMIRFDTFMIALQYFSFSLAGKPYMGVGRNLSYRKSLFFRTKGFARHYHLLSGDDDLFVNENASASNTGIEIHPDSFTYSDPKKSFSGWYTQKKRHIGTGRFYKGSHKLLLFLNSFSGILFFLSLIALLVMHVDRRIIVSLYGIKLLVELPILYVSSKKLQETDLIWLFPLLEFFNVMLQPVFFLSNLVSKQKPWK